MKDKKIKLMLKDGSEYEALSFGADKSVAGEVVFATGMAGYPEALTDPSFAGQILVLTYPLIGNYGVPAEAELESKKVQVAGLIVANYIDTPSHHTSKMTLGAWLRQSGVPLLEVKDTREITQKLREQGVMLGKIVFGRENIPFYNPNRANLVAQVSAKKIQMYGTAGPRLPFPFRAVIISNGPGAPKKAAATIRNVKKIIAKKIPTLGICLGNQILALAQGGTTYKLKFGHRSQNQPAVESKSGRGFLTTQNHGFAVKKIPKGFREWFYNANDHTNEGIIHETLPLMSVQFHPESSPGPMDTDWIFDYFLEQAGIL